MADLTHLNPKQLNDKLADLQNYQKDLMRRAQEAQDAEDRKKIHPVRIKDAQPNPR